MFGVWAAVKIALLYNFTYAPSESSSEKRVAESRDLANGRKGLRVLSRPHGEPVLQIQKTTLAEGASSAQSKLAHNANLQSRVIGPERT